MANTLSAGVVVVRRQGDRWDFLLLRAYRYWDFPKGQVEPGEDPFDAAVREVAEETTLTDLTFPWGHDYFETPRYGNGKVARYYLGRTRRRTVSLPYNPEIGKAEHDEYRWLSYEKAHPLLVPRVQAVIDWARDRLRDPS